MSADLQAVAEISKKLAADREALKSEETVLNSLMLKNGQDFETSLSVCGKRFMLVRMGANYYPERVKALDVIRKELIEYQKGIVQFHIGAIEGIEFKLVQASCGRQS